MDVRPITGELVDIPLKELHIRYIPMAKLENWWSGEPTLMNLMTSPHVEVMDIFKDHGFKWGLLKATRYAEERRFRRKVGMPQWNEKYLKQHFRKRYDLFKSIKKNGFNPAKRASKPVAILKEPFWNTRFMWSNPVVRGLEIWNGGGASSACYALGYETIKGVWFEDAHPGSMKCKDLERKFKWSQ